MKKKKTKIKWLKLEKGKTYTIRLLPIKKQLDKQA